MFREGHSITEWTGVGVDGQRDRGRSGLVLDRATID